MNAEEYRIFKKGSRTYFYSSIFFPEPWRSDVFTLYSFVRVADDFVDENPPREDEFLAFREEYNRGLLLKKSDNAIIDGFIRLMDRKNFDPSWTEAFLDAMEADLSKKKYETLEETCTYMYGSAEVIGLFMARIMDLDEKSLRAAQMLGRAMQYINFIRDIDEDLGLGRTYLPLEGSGLSSLDEKETRSKPEIFKNFIRGEVNRYRAWQAEAETGYSFIPKRFLIPIKTAADMYNYTARTIERDPFIVYRRRIKPRLPRLLGTILKNSMKIKGKNHPRLEAR